MFSDTLSIEFRCSNRVDNDWQGKFKKESSGKKSDEAGGPVSGPGGSLRGCGEKSLLLSLLLLLLSPKLLL